MELIKNNLFAKAIVLLLAFAVTLAFTAMPETVHAAKGGPKGDPQPTFTLTVKDGNGNDVDNYIAKIQRQTSGGWADEGAFVDGKYYGSFDFMETYRVVVTAEGYKDYTGEGFWGEDKSSEAVVLESTAPPQPKTASLTVNVTDSSTELAIRDAAIRVYNGTTEEDIAANNDGTWSVPVNEGYFYKVFVTKEGYDEGESEWFYVTTTDAITKNVQLTPSITPEQQLAAKKAEAKQELENYKKDEDFKDKTAVQELKAEYAELIDQAESEGSVDQLLSAAKALIDQQPLNPPAAYHTLSVVDEAGQPIENFKAQIKVVRKLDSGALGEVFETAENGSFYNKEFDTTKYYKLVVSAHGYNDYVSADAYEGYGLKNGTVSLPATVTLTKAEALFTVSVKDKDTGEAIENFTATVFEMKGYPATATEFEVSKDGVFYKAWDKWNDYKFTVTAEGYADKTIDFNYTGQNHVYPTSIELEMTPAGRAALDLAAAEEAGKIAAGKCAEAADEAAKAEASRKAAVEAAKTPGQAAVDAAKKAKADAEKAAQKAAEAKLAAEAGKEAADKAVESAQKTGDDQAIQAATFLQSEAKKALDSAAKAKETADKAVAAAKEAVEKAEKEKKDAVNQTTVGSPDKDKTEEAAKYTPIKVKLSKVKGAKKKIKVTWKKVSKNATAYQVRIIDTKTKKAVTRTFKQSRKNTIKKTIKGLKKGKYAVKVRAINKVSGKIYMGAWSRVRTVKVK